MGVQPAAKQVVSSYPTHEECHSSLYKGNHWNDNFTLLSIGDNIISPLLMRYGIWP